jgi:hypothetical protein
VVTGRILSGTVSTVYSFSPQARRRRVIMNRNILVIWDLL